MEPKQPQLSQEPMARKSTRDVVASVTCIVSLQGDLELVSRVADADLLAPTFESSTGVGVVDHEGVGFVDGVGTEEVGLHVAKADGESVVHLLPDAVITKFIATVKYRRSQCFRRGCS